jgi:hypothetical protein
MEMHAYSQRHPRLHVSAPSQHHLEFSILIMATDARADDFKEQKDTYSEDKSAASGHFP